MTLFIIMIIIFLGVHLVPAFPEFRQNLIAQRGEKNYRSTFSLISLISFIGLIYGYSLTPTIPMWTPPSFLAHIAHFLMLFVFPLFISAKLPTGKIKAKIKHPTVAAMKIWAFAHLLVKGDVAALILFGSVLAYAVIARISLKKREKAKLITAPKAVKDSILWDMVAIVAGLALYGIFVGFAHKWLIGVAVF